jgi:hypothetical protein
MEKAEAAMEKAQDAMAKVSEKVSDLVPDAIEEKALAVKKHFGGFFSEFVTFINRGVGLRWLTWTKLRLLIWFLFGIWVFSLEIRTSWTLPSV